MGKSDEMKTIKIDKYYKHMIAHRGLSGIETENTVFSFLAAANHSYLGISCDLYASKDDKLILTSQTTMLKYGLLNLDIQSFNYEELIKYSLVDRKTENLNQFLYIPQLRDYLPICKAYEKKALISIHSSLSLELLSQMIKEIEEYYQLDQCMMIVENKNQAEHLVKLIDSKHIFFHHQSMNQGEYEFSNKHKVNVYLDRHHLDKTYVKKCHLIGLEVMTGVINEKENAEKTIKMDVDYILTNILE